MDLTPDLKTTLSRIVGEGHLILDEGERAFYSQDVSKRCDYLTCAVVQPSDKEELAAVVGAAASAGYAVFPRGGGMSYTSGYLPSEERAISVDLGRMDRVLEINKTDMYVTVEAGCTWATLHEVLKETGLRTPYWGTLSGIHATVGGSMSQNSIFFGSGHHGTAADSVTCFEVVLADGSILKTGAGAKTNSGPFQRYYGPDTTGMFVGDAGALGVKATVTMRLMKAPEHTGFLSFSFEDHTCMFEAASHVARAGLASEGFGFDPYLQSQRMKRESLAKDVKVLKNVMKSSGSALGALKEGAKLALAGRRFMEDVPFSYHFMVENQSRGAVEEAVAEIRRICTAVGGKEIENAIPKIVRANPFMPLNNMVGPEGERWLPVHGLVPHSKAVQVANAIEALFEKHRKAMKASGIETGYLFASVGTSTCVLEPVFFWPDELMQIQKRTVETSAQKGFTDFGVQKETRELVFKIRAELVELFNQMGAVHLQIGKAYKYAEGVEEDTVALVRALKKTLDPHNRINPGALGL